MRPLDLIPLTAGLGGEIKDGLSMLFRAFLFLFKNHREVAKTIQRGLFLVSLMVIS
jgi:hypothetical protein